VPAFFQELKRLQGLMRVGQPTAMRSEGGAQAHKASALGATILAEMLRQRACQRVCTWLAPGSGARGGPSLPHRVDAPGSERGSRADCRDAATLHGCGVERRGGGGGVSAVVGAARRSTWGAAKLCREYLTQPVGVRVSGA
jgi:hypothetical protein